MSDEEARAAFQAIRWSDTEGKPYCPKCGCVSVYAYRTRALWRCQGMTRRHVFTSREIEDGLKFPTDEDISMPWLNEIGARGWELVRQEYAMESAIWVFKRPIG